MKFWEALRELQTGKWICLEEEEGISYISDLNELYLELYGSAAEDMSYWFESEWLSFEPDHESRRWWDVIDELKKGTKFRRKAWLHPEAWVEADHSGNIHFHDECHLPFKWTIQDLEAHDWIEVK